MQVQPITNNTFASKNTFLQKSRHAFDVDKKMYFKSLHYEAKSRLHYMNYQKADRNLAQIEKIDLKNALNFVKVVLILVSEKLQSMTNQADAFHMYPRRFLVADKENVLPHRFYETNQTA